MAKLLRLEAVREITGLSRSAIYADHTFPQQVKIGERAVAWVESEVIEWVNSRIDARVTA